MVLNPISRADVAAKVRAVNLNLAADASAFGFCRHNLPELVGEDEGGFVLAV